MKITCVTCGRKQDVEIKGNESFVMPEHDNYMKTDKCPASGKKYALFGPQTPSLATFPLGDFALGGPHRDPRLAALALMVAFEGKRRH